MMKYLQLSKMHYLPFMGFWIHFPEDAALKAVSATENVGWIGHGSAQAYTQLDELLLYGKGKATGIY